MDPRTPFSREHHVLVVVDRSDTIGAWQWQDLLETGGYRVHLALGAVEALRIARTTHPRVVLCDIHRSRPNALWLAARLREASLRTAVILVTDDAELPPLEWDRVGVVGCVRRPIDIEALLAMVRKAVRASIRADSLPPWFSDE